MRELLAIAGVVLGILGALDVLVVLALCKRSSQISRLEERGETPHPE